MTNESNDIDFDFSRACDYKSAYVLVKQAMEKVKSRASEGLWQRLDEVAVELEKVSKEALNDD